MGKLKGVDEWLKNDEEQLRWIESYCEKRRFALARTHSQSKHENIRQTLLFCSRDGEAGKEFFRVMQQAWYQYQYKKKVQKNQISFYLKSDVISKLKKLTKYHSVTQNEMIALLITHGFELKEANEKELKAKKEELVQKYAKPKTQKVLPMIGFIALDLKFRLLKDEFSKQKSHLESILGEFALLKVKEEHENWSELTEDEMHKLIEGEISKAKAHYSIKE